MEQKKSSAGHSHFYEGIRRKFPFLTDRLNQMGFYAGYENIEAFSGFVVIFSAALSIVVAANLYAFGFGPYSVLGILTGPAFYTLVYVIFSFIADSRARFIEKMLPDNLQLISANVRAGMTVDKAIWLSARPEFGILEEEIRKTGGQTMGGKPLKQALTEMARRFNSEIFQRAVRLLTEGMESGGEIAKLLDETASYIRTAQSMQKETNANVAMYVTLIFLAAAFGAPLLFAVSIHFVENLEKISLPEIPNIPTGASLGGAPSGEESSETIKLKAKTAVSTEYLSYFALAYLFVTSFFSSMIVGLIKSGKEKSGLKIFPVLFGVAFVVFIAGRFLVQSFLSFGAG